MGNEMRKINFSSKNEKNRGTGKNRKKTLKKKRKRETGKSRKLQEIQKQDNARFWRVKISARRDFDEISGNAENGNKNEVFSNVPK